MRSLPLPEVLQLLDELPAKYACLAAIGVTTGCRITELLLLQRHDLLERDGTLKREIAFVKLKSKKLIHRKMMIPEDYHPYILRHLQEEEQRGYDMPHNYVFRGKLGKPLSRITAYNRFRRLLGSGYGTHWMRKTFAQSLFGFFLQENPRDPMRALDLTRRALGHERLDTTVKYLGIREEAIATAQNSVFNIRKIKSEQRTPARKRL